MTKYYSDISQLADAHRALLLAAHDATQGAYAPYSKFQVGAAVLLADGTILKGSNIENAAYPLCLCAERTVLAVAHALYPATLIIAMAITARHADKPVLQPVSPCGGCRQVLSEVENRYKSPIEIILQGEVGDIMLLSSVSELLPHSFSGDSL